MNTVTQRYFLDTEFVEDGFTIMPISLAFVREDGRELYIEFEFDEAKAKAHDFVRENVLPHLRGQEQYTREQAARRIANFLGVGPDDNQEPKPDIEVWAYFADYDWVLFAQVFGTMMDLPDGCPKFCMDLMQWWAQLGYPRGVKPPKPENAHDALADAHWNLEFYKNLEAYVGQIEFTGYVGGMQGDGKRFIIDGGDTAITVNTERDMRSLYCHNVRFTLTDLGNPDALERFREVMRDEETNP